MRVLSRQVEVVFVELDGFEFPRAELCELLEALEETGFMESVVIHDKDLERVLVRRGVVRKSARGSCRRGEHLEAFQRELLTKRTER